jgi:hypothetical protein
MANEIYDSTWWGNTIDTASSIGTSTEMIQGQFNLTKIGDELVTNGDFDTDSNWSKFNGATISDGKANIIGDGSGFTFIQQFNVFEVGKYYKITADVNISSGLGLKFQDGVTNENFGFALNSGSYTFYAKANNSTLVIGRRTGGTAFNSYIDNVSVKEVRATTVEASKCLADTIHRIGLQDIQN